MGEGFATCSVCEQEIFTNNGYLYFGSLDGVICDDCLDETPEYEVCEHCANVFKSHELNGGGYCEGCAEFHEPGEWVSEYGGEEEFMETYDPDKD